MTSGIAASRGENGGSPIRAYLNRKKEGYGMDYRLIDGLLDGVCMVVLTALAAMLTLAVGM